MGDHLASALPRYQALWRACGSPLFDLFDVGAFFFSAQSFCYQESQGDRWYGVNLIRVFVDRAKFMFGQSDGKAKR
jgi:hypothetical protein